MDYIRFIAFFIIFFKIEYYKGATAEDSNALGTICTYDRRLADWMKKQQDIINQHTYHRTKNEPLEPHPGYMTYHVYREEMVGDLKQPYRLGIRKKSTSPKAGDGGSLNSTSLAEGSKNKTRPGKTRKAKTTTTAAPVTSTQAAPSGEDKKENPIKSSETGENDDGDVEYYDYDEDGAEGVPVKMKLDPNKPNTELEITQDEYVRTVINRKEQP